MRFPLYYRYDGDSIKGKDGESIQVDPEGGGLLDLNAYVLGMYWVSDYKILGANYDFHFYGALADTTFEAPILALQDSVDTNITDFYCQPINLGWHKDRADFMASLGVYIPTGEYDPEDSENLGLGMWSFEVFPAPPSILAKQRAGISPPSLFMKRIRRKRAPT